MYSPAELEAIEGASKNRNLYGFKKVQQCMYHENLV